MGHLGHGKEEGEEVREPEIVGGHKEVLVSVHLLGVNIAAGSPALEVLSHIGGPMDPTVGAEGREMVSRDTAAASNTYWAYLGSWPEEWQVIVLESM